MKWIGTLFIFILLAVSLWGLQAYRVHETLTSPDKTFEMATGENAQLIAAYVDKGILAPTWHFAFYNPKTRNIFVTSVKESLWPWPHITLKKQACPTEYNYSSLAIQRTLLKNWRGQAPALLFNGTWYSRDDQKDALSRLTSLRIQNASFGKIGLFYSKNGFWVGLNEIKSCGGDYSFPPAGPGGILVPPELSDKNLPTVIEITWKSTNGSERALVFFNGAIIKAHTTKPLTCPFELRNLTGALRIWREYFEYNPNRMALWVSRPLDTSSKECTNETTWVIIALRNGDCGNEWWGKLEDT